MKELKGFQRIELLPGEARKVAFTLRSSDLDFFTVGDVWAAEKGDFDVFVGTNSVDVQKARFSLR